MSQSSSRCSLANLGTGFRPQFFLNFGRWTAHWSRIWFRFTLRGLESVPNRQVMFVGNHSGVGVAEVLCLVGAFSQRFGLRRRVTGMMHDAFVAAPIVGWFARGFGAVRALPTNAYRALDHGHDLAVFPGGDIDSCRPFYEARRVHFGSRRGYIRIALERRLPIVPIATIGSHYSYLLMPGGETLARVLRTDRYLRCVKLPLPVALFGLIASVVAAGLHVCPPGFILVALLALAIPNPVTITSTMLPAIDVAAATDHISDPAERVEAAHRLVLQALQNAVATMEHGQISADPRRSVPKSLASSVVFAKGAGR